MDLLSKYKNGQCAEVWHELIELGDAIWTAPYRVAAEAIALETMRAARKNIETIHARLLILGYNFFDFITETTPDEAELLPGPPKDCETIIKSIEEKIGPLPLSLKAWFAHVGRVNFTGSFSDLNSDGKKLYLDPIVIIGAEDLLAEVQFHEENFGTLAKFMLTIAPDHYIKVGEGGGPCFAQFDSPGADFFMIAERKWRFTDYLRHVFKWGGFPGFENYPSHELAEKARYLNEGLLQV